MPELSVIIPFCNEWPQVIWTVKNIAEELRDRVDFEIITVNNFGPEAKAQGREEDKAGAYLKNVARGNKWLTALEYPEKLSHWNAKRVGVESTDAPFLWFCDAHNIISRDSLYKMFELYKSSYKTLEGTIHLPLTYQIMEWHSLIYSLVTDYDIGKLHYRFASYRPSEKPYEVPCMSTCGVMMTRELYEDVGGWPKELGIYGGGEDFLNFTLGVMGYKKWIMPVPPLYHHGDRRGYAATYTDGLRNRAIASYLYGGEAWMLRQLDNSRGRPNVKKIIAEDVLVKCKAQRDFIFSKQRYTVKEFIDKWKTATGLTV